MKICKLDMPTSTLVTLLLATCSIGTVELIATVTSSGQATSVLYVDAAPPPVSLDAFVAKAVAVVHAVVVRPATEPVKDPGSSPRAPRAVRYHTLRVIDVIKGDNARPIATEIVVKQYGGTLVIDGQERRTAYPAPVFTAGEEFVLFLHRAGDATEYTVEAGAAGAFKVNAATLRVSVPQEVRRSMTTFANRESLELGELIRTLQSIKGPR